MNNKQKSILSGIALVIAALGWGSAYAITKDALENIKPYNLMAMRFGLSTILLSAIFIKRILTVKKRDIIIGIITGACMFLSFFTLIIGLGHTTASKQSFLLGADVLMVPILAWLINKSKINIYSIIGVVLATIGIGLITLNESLQISMGDTISIISASLFALRLVLVEKYNNDTEPVISNIIQFTVTTMLFTILAVIIEGIDINVQYAVTGQIVYLAVGTTVIPYLFQDQSQKYLTSTTTALILTLESVFGSVFAIALLGETLNIKIIAGCATVLLGIVVASTKLKVLCNK